MDEIINCIIQLEAMKNYLMESASTMEKHTNDLHQTLNAYKEQGFPSDIANNYERAHLDQTRSSAEAVAMRIRTFHCSYIDGVIEDLKRALAR
jgi:hypothetical protein